MKKPASFYTERCRATKEFVIEQRNIKDGFDVARNNYYIVPDSDLFGYSGKAITPDLNHRLYPDMLKARDYMIRYENNLESGEGIAIITGIGQ